MRIRVTNAYRTVGIHAEVLKPDSDDDVFVNLDGACYLSRKSTERVITALRWALSKRTKKRKAS